MFGNFFGVEKVDRYFGNFFSEFCGLCTRRHLEKSGLRFVYLTTSKKLIDILFLRGPTYPLVPFLSQNTLNYFTNGPYSQLYLVCLYVHSSVVFEDYECNSYRKSYDCIFYNNPKILREIRLRHFEFKNDILLIIICVTRQKNTQ